MPFQRALTDAEERALVVDYEDGFRVFELEARYSVSNRTVHRILADAGASRQKGPRRKRRSDRRELKPRVLKPCGTEAAYRRHKRKGEYPCDACLNVHVKYNANRAN